MNVTPNAMTILERRYLKREDGKIVETPAEMAWRVAQFVARVDPQPKEACALFLEIIDKLEFIPNSPTLMNAGKKDAQLSACFVLPIEDHMEGIFDAIKNMALVQKTGGDFGKPVVPVKVQEYRILFIHDLLHEQLQKLI